MDDGTFREVGPLQTADYREAAAVILNWQSEENPAATVVLLDQPTYREERHWTLLVENLVGSPVSLHMAALQPANTSKMEMFGNDAPVWEFLSLFGDPADPGVTSPPSLVVRVLKCRS